MRRWALLAVLALAFALRLARWPYRWNQIALAYGAYQEPFVRALEAGDISLAVSTFYGLHPPFYSLIYSLTYWLSGSMGSFLYLSLGFSVVAVWATATAASLSFGGRSGVMAGLFLATSLYHCHYALEVNNYPLLVCLTALGMLSYLKFLSGGRPGPWIIFTILNHWTHLLSVIVSGLQVLFMGRSEQGRRRLAWPFFWIVVCSIPLVGKVLSLLGRGSTYHNDSGGLTGFFEQVVLAMSGRFGPGWILVLLAGAIIWGTLQGLRGRQRHLTLYLGGALLLGSFGVALTTFLGISAAHQHPYYLYLLPFACVLLARAIPKGGLGLVVALLLVLPSLSANWQELRGAREQLLRFEKSPHALRMALQEVKAQHLWLLAPPLYPDDDKLAQDVAYSLLDPSWQCIFYHPESMAFEYVDYRYGQPYLCDRGGLSPRDYESSTWPESALVVYSFTDIYSATMPRILDHIIAKKQTLKVVLYDDGLSPDYLFRMSKLLELVSNSIDATVEQRKVGLTHLFVVEAP